MVHKGVTAPWLSNYKDVEKNPYRVVSQLSDTTNRTPIVLGTKKRHQRQICHGDTDNVDELPYQVSTASACLCVTRAQYTRAYRTIVFRRPTSNFGHLSFLAPTSAITVKLGMELQVR